MTEIATPPTIRPPELRAWTGPPALGARRSFAGVALFASALVHAAAFVAFGPFASSSPRPPSAPEGAMLVQVSLAPLPAETPALSAVPAPPKPAKLEVTRPARVAPQREALSLSEAVAGPVEGLASSAASRFEEMPATAPSVAIGPSRSAASPPASPTLVPAAYLHAPEPAYPVSAREEGEEGVVLLRVRISRSGLPEEIVLDRSSGFGALDRAAIAGVKRWTFTPARRGDEAIEAWMHVPIRFRLG